MTRKKLPLDQILPGDCVDVLAALPPKSVDLIFADPPYNLQLQNDLYRPNLTKVDAVDDAWDKFATFQDYDDFTRAWLLACRRVLKDTGTLWVIGTYHNIYRVGAVLQDLDFWILNDIIWVKTNPMPNFRGVRFTNAHETLLWAQKIKGARYTFNHQVMKGLNDDLQMRSDWELPLCTGKERLRAEGGEKAHTTQKPEALLYRVILSSSDLGDVVLDPFFGTGTTGAVAKKLKRHWIGVERDPGYIAAAQARLDEAPPVRAPAALYEFADKRRRPRVPFGALVESGWLRTGQTLYFGPRGNVTARIMANGTLKCRSPQGEPLSGSIHQVGRALQQGPCNGWEHWHYLDEAAGERVPIDRLREKYLAARAARPESAGEKPSDD